MEEKKGKRGNMYVERRKWSQGKENEGKGGKGGKRDEKIKGKGGKEN